MFVYVVFCCLFFFFKQKTAYEMRISDWSSDVCSSDLPACVRSTVRTRNAAICASTASACVSSSGSPMPSAHMPAALIAGLGGGTSELQSLMRISYAVFCLKKKITQNPHRQKHAHASDPKSTIHNQTTCDMHHRELHHKIRY